MNANTMNPNTTNGNSRMASFVTLPEPDRLGVMNQLNHHPILIQPAVSHEQLSLLLPALSKYPELDLKTLYYHAQQSDGTAKDGYWHAAINESRSFMESLMMSIVLVERKETLSKFRKSMGARGGVRWCRRYLRENGFLDYDEDILVGHVYSIASVKGGHFGMTDEVWCRTARQMVCSTGYYMTHRYERWKAGERRPQTQTPAPEISSTKTGWINRLRSFVGGLFKKTAGA